MEAKGIVFREHTVVAEEFCNAFDYNLFESTLFLIIITNPFNVQAFVSKFVKNVARPFPVQMQELGSPLKKNLTSYVTA